MWWRKIQSETEVYDWLWTSNAAPVACLFLLKIMLFYDEILLSDQPLPGVQNAKTNDIKIRRKLLNCVMESSTFFDQSWAAIITILSLLFSNLVLYKVTRHDRLTRKVPIVTKIKFLLTISIHCQEKIWELIKWSLKRNCLDLSSNSLN